MKKYIAIALLSGTFLTSCSEYNRVLKSTDYEYKYEAAKSYFGKGQYTKASTLLEELITILKGTENAQESLYMLAMSYYNQGDYITASHYFTSYYNTYPKGTYTELARFHSGKALFLDTPEPRLDQSSTFSAISELQMFMEYFPQSERKTEAQLMIFTLQSGKTENSPFTIFEKFLNMIFLMVTFLERTIMFEYLFFPSTTCPFPSMTISS